MQFEYNYLKRWIADKFYISYNYFYCTNFLLHRITPSYADECKLNIALNINK